MLILNLLKLLLLLHLHLLKVLLDLGLISFHVLLLLQMRKLLLDCRVQGLKGAQTMLYLRQLLLLIIIDD